MSPRAVDKRARPGNDATPGPAGPPSTLSATDFDTAEQAVVKVDKVEVTDGAKD
ncbi:hypothetical protein AB0P21_32150 [Kribbella sp. NPDC056861]|uniref:hypothetical protein n=1 Tax=Kribbella sp. NPDC056861 TaxID=3154857 RepID=UPI003438C4C3